MAITLFDKLKRAIAAYFFPLGIVDDDPTEAADGDVSPLRTHKTSRGVYVHVANAADISGGGGGGGEVTQGDGSGTVGDFWPIRVSDGAAFIPFPTALDGGRFATASLLTDGTNDVAVLNAAPTTQYGVVTRNIPSGTQNVAAALQTATTFFPVRLVTDGSNFATISTTDNGTNAPASALAVNAWVMGRIFSGTAAGQGCPISVDGSGRVISMTAGAAPIADGTTHVYTRFPALGTAQVAFTSGVAILKATGGRIRNLHIHYTGATVASLYVQLHNAATATTPTDNTWVMAWPIDANTPAASIIDFLSQIDIPCSSGIKLAFSSTRLTYTAAASETGAVVGWGA